MSYKIIEKKISEIKIEISVDTDRIKKVTDLVVSRLANSIKIDGFRPGKAPRFVLEREIGKDRFWGEVLDKIISELYYETIVAEKISPISRPKINIKSFVPDESLVFEAMVAILPDITDLEYKNLKIKKEHIDVKSKDIDSALKHLAQRQTKEVLVKRPSRLGDKVEIDFEGTLKGLPFDGGQSNNHPVVLGSKTFVPGFEEKLVGRKEGDELSFKIKFPKDYHSRNLANQEVDFNVKIKAVFERQVPPVDDNLAKSFNFKTLNALRKEVEKELRLQAELEAKRKTEQKVIDAILDNNQIEAPEILIEEQVHQMIHEAEHNLSHQGLKMEQFLDMSKKTLGQLENEMRPEAEKRVKISLILGEVAKRENIGVSDDEIDKEIANIIDSNSWDQNSEKVKSVYEESERRRELGNSILIKKIINKLWEYNVIE